MAASWLGQSIRPTRQAYRQTFGALLLSFAAPADSLTLPLFDRSILPFLPCKNSHHDCSGHGSCIKGSCECDLGWTGHDCRFDSCPAGTKPRDRPDSAQPGGHCSGNGLCLAGKCSCGEGFEGSDCSRVAGPASGLPSKRTYCSGHGSLMPRLGRCLCETGWQGDQWYARVCRLNDRPNS